MASIKSNRDRDVLGQGLAFPFQLDASGKAMLVSGSQDIEQSIRIILGTMPGERVMRPAFGCRARELIFAPHDVATEGLLIHYVEEALGYWEPRVDVNQVRVKDTVVHDGALVVEIDYTVKATHDERSIVYPFFIADEEEV